MGMINEVGVDGVLQVASSIVWKKYVHGFRPWIGLILCRYNGMVDGMYYVWVW